MDCFHSFLPWFLPGPKKWDYLEPEGIRRTCDYDKAICFRMKIESKGVCSSYDSQWRIANTRIDIAFFASRFLHYFALTFFGELWCCCRCCGSSFSALRFSREMHFWCEPMTHSMQKGQKIFYFNAVLLPAHQFSQPHFSHSVSMAFPSWQYKFDQIVFPPVPPSLSPSLSLRIDSSWIQCQPLNAFIDIKTFSSFPARQGPWSFNRPIQDYCGVNWALVSYEEKNVEALAIA